MAAGWLAAHHSRWDTDRSVLEGALASVGCLDPSLRRIIVGQANEVYEATCAEGSALVVRVAHRPDHRFFVEVAAMARASAAGVPVPEVLLVEDLDPATGATAIMVEERVPGDMLSDAAAAMEPDDVAGLAAQVGEHLAAIHSVSVGGYGNVDANLEGQYDDYAAWFVDAFVEREVPAASAVLRDDRAGVALIDRAVEAIATHRPLLSGAESRLAHGDFNPTNILVAGNRVSGFVDWEAAKGAPPANDFGWWDCFFDDGPVKTADVRAGYRRHAEVDDGFDILRHLVVLRVSVSYFVHAASVGDAAGLAGARSRLERELASPDGASR